MASTLRVLSINDESLQPGDALFFSKGSTPSYAGVYISDGKFVMCSQGKDEVLTRSVAAYKSQFIGARTNKLSKASTSAKRILRQADAGC